MTKVPNLSELIKQAIESRLMDIHTAILGRIEKYDHEKQIADIQPLLKRKEEILPLLLDVPILFPRTQEFFISFPVKKGDYVQIIFNETNIDNMLSKSLAKINYKTRFSLNGAIAIPGIYPLSKPLTGAHKENLVVGKDKGVQIHIEDEKIRLGSKKADQALALAKKVKGELEKIRSAFQTHVHTSHGSPTTTQIIPIGDIASKKVVAE